MINLQTVVETREFQRRAAAIMTEDERQNLINFIAMNPGAGTAIGGGLYKVRFAREGQGKSTGYRTIYLFYGRDIPIFLLTVFAKNEKANVSKSEKAQLEKAARLIKESYRNKDERI